MFAIFWSGATVVSFMIQARDEVKVFVVWPSRFLEVLQAA